jgi:hypothetical protein
VKIMDHSATGPEIERAFQIVKTRLVTEVESTLSALSMIRVTSDKSAAAHTDTDTDTDTDTHRRQFARTPHSFAKIKGHHIPRGRGGGRGQRLLLLPLAEEEEHHPQHPTSPWVRPL